MPKGSVFGLTLLAFALLLPCTWGAGQAEAAQRGLAPDLQQALRDAVPEQRVPVLIVMEEQADAEALLPIARSMNRADRRRFAVTTLKSLASISQTRVISFLEAERNEGRAAEIRPLWIANGIAAQLIPASIEALLQFPEIRTVLWDPPLDFGVAEDIVETPVPISSSDEGQTQLRDIWWQLHYVRAPEVWAMGYNGEGIVVSIQDTGVDRYHPDLQSHMWNNVDEIPNNGIDDDQNGFIDDTWGWNFQANNNNPYPLNAGENHGTGCAGIAAGDGTAGTNTGVAPRARIMSCKVNSWSQNIAGIQYSIDNGADIISMSRSQKWRFTPKPDYDWWRANTDNELLTGIFHANSIGNEGDNQNTDPIPFNIAAPGGCPAPWRHPNQVQAGISVITAVGAVDQYNVIANYSSVGPFTWEDIRVHWPIYPWPMRPEYQDYPWWGGLPGIIKPDIVAPGPNTRTTGFPGNGYMTFSGTSAATPHVAGAMALCLQANPNLSPEQMSMALQTTAVDLGAPGKDNYYGAGKLDCYQAVLAALAMPGYGTVRGTVTASASDLPIPDVLVEVLGDTLFTTTDEEGEYALQLSSGEHTLQFSHPHYLPATVVVNVVAGLVHRVDVSLDANPADAPEVEALLPGLRLDQNLPNPFRSVTTVQFNIPRSSAARLAVYDISGREVRVLLEGSIGPGEQVASWDGRDQSGRMAPTGLYLCRLEAGEHTLTRTMVLMR